MKTILLTALILLTACTNTPKQAILYTSHYADDYTYAILAKCKHESDMLAFMTIQGMMARYEEVTEEDVTYLRKMLLDSCVKHFKITI